MEKPSKFVRNRHRNSGSDLPLKVWLSQQTGVTKAAGEAWKQNKAK